MIFNDIINIIKSFSSLKFLYSAEISNVLLLKIEVFSVSAAGKEI